MFLLQKVKACKAMIALPNTMLISYYLECKEQP